MRSTFIVFISITTGYIARNIYHDKPKEDKKEMTISEIRALTGLNKADFAKMYNIPYRTIQNWECGQRECPEYVRSLLERAVKEDFNYK